MSQVEGVDTSRRRVLIGTTAAVAFPGVVAAAGAFVKSWNPSAKAKAAGAPVSQDISSIEPGQMVVVEWQGSAVYVVHRTEEMLANLPKNDPILRDPKSEESKQPEYAKNAHRSMDPKILVVRGVCTHLGCGPGYKPEVGGAELGTQSYGGFYCPCHASKYDLAGRVYKNVPAPLNLEVPPHSVKDGILTVGDAV